MGQAKPPHFHAAARNQKTPAIYQMPYQYVYVSIESSNGQNERIHGWWIPAQTPSPKRLKFINGGDHNNSAALGGEDYLRSIREIEKFASEKS